MEPERSGSDNIFTDLKSLSGYENFLDKTKKEFDKRYEKNTKSNVQLSDFECKTTLGTGSFGRVLLVIHKATKNFYALKAMEKDQIVRTKQVEHILAEKKVLQAIRHPFSVHLKFCFKDNAYLYLVLPYINGGELFSQLRKSGKFSESHARFYACQVILCFEYLHHMDLVYRDLKPENLLICSNGYLKVTDFGFCKIVKSRTWSLCGTPEYLAPEIILSKGYGRSVDWWAFGILVYEMTAGHSPFFAEEPIKIYEKIVSCKVKYPAHFSKDLKDLLKNLLVAEPTKRFGVLRRGADDLKQHKWFQGQDWFGFLKLTVEPPFVPKVTGAGDCSNFEKFEESALVRCSKDQFAKQFEEF